MNYLIEKVKTEDAKEMLQLLQQVGAESDNLTFGAEGLQYTVEEEENFLFAMKNSEEKVLYVARGEGKIIGICSFNRLYGRFAHRGEIAVMVLKDYWHMGVGTRLMENAIDFAYNVAKVNLISLQVRADNIHAIALYKKLGFKDIGYFEKFFKINGLYYDAKLMNLYIKNNYK